MDNDTINKANDLLQNGILINTNTGVLCVSLSDALSSDLNLSAEELKTVAELLILQEEINKNKTRDALHCFATPLSSDATIDSDDPTSDCSGITIDLNSIRNSYAQQLSEPISIPLIEKAIKLECVDSDTNSALVTISSDNQSDSSNTKDPNATVTPQPIDVSKLPPKRRGGWPKGRKRKPELLHLPPKAPATGYNLYLNDMRKQFKESSLPFYEITKIIGNRWSSLSLEEKKPYLERAEEDKRRYRDELRSYRQSGSYQLYLAKKRKKKVQNNVLSESDMDATDDIDDEDNEELYCRTCDQWFHNLHNKREHLQGRQHILAVVGDMKIELDDGNASSTAASSSNQDNLSVEESIVNLISVVSKREHEIKVLKVRMEEAKAANNALYQQLNSLRDRELTLKNDIISLRNVEKEIEEKLFQLWKVPSLFITTDLNSLNLEPSEYLTE